MICQVIFKRCQQQWITVAPLPTRGVAGIPSGIHFRKPRPVRLGRSLEVQTLTTGHLPDRSLVKHNQDLSLRLVCVPSRSDVESCCWSTPQASHCRPGRRSLPSNSQMVQSSCASLLGHCLLTSQHTKSWSSLRSLEDHAPHKNVHSTKGGWPNQTLWGTCQTERVSVRISADQVQAGRLQGCPSRFQQHIQQRRHR